MKLAFLYQPVPDLDEAAAFYRNELGWEEAWREPDDTIAFSIPGGDVQVMVSTDQYPAGPMYQVDSLTDWLAEHSDLKITVPPYEIPGGTVAGLNSPGGLTFYVFDMADG